MTFTYTPPKPTKYQPVIDHLLAGNELCGSIARERFGFPGLSKLVQDMRAQGLHFAVREEKAEPKPDGSPNGRSRIYYRVVEEHEATPVYEQHAKSNWIKEQLLAGKELCDKDVQLHFGGGKESYGGRLASVRQRMEKDGHKFTSRHEVRGKARVQFWRLQTPGEDGEAPLPVPVARNGKAKKQQAVMPFGMPTDAPHLAIQAPQLGQILGVYLTHLDEDGEVTIGLRTAGGRYLFKMVGADLD